MLPITRSLADPVALTDWVGQRYPRLLATRCRLQRFGFHDTYRIEGEAGTFFLRLYAPDRRDPADIGYELDLVEHLAQRGVGAARALLDRDGQRLHRLVLPEGERFAVIFEQAPGESLRGIPDESDCRRFGAAIADLHAASDDFDAHTVHARPVRDLRFLLDGPLGYLETHALDLVDLSALRRDADAVRSRLEPHLQQLDVGVVHMDAHVGNYAVTDATLTFFDFDFAGTGFRIVDLLEPHYHAIERGNPALWQAAVDAYRSRRRLSDLDVLMSDVLLAAMLMWALEINLHRGRSIGLEFADLPRRVKRFHRAVQRLSQL